MLQLAQCYGAVRLALLQQCEECNLQPFKNNPLHDARDILDQSVSIRSDSSFESLLDLYTPKWLSVRKQLEFKKY